MQVPFLDLKVQYQEIKQELSPIIEQIMTDCAFIGGPQVSGFENEFADYCGSKYCIGVNSGTDALRFALMASGVGPGDEVITVPNTFIATSEAISQTRATPLFCDIDPNTCNMDPQALETHISPRTKAIIPVHLYGQPADMDAILSIARAKGLFVIEDACQAHGALYKKKRAGSMGIAGCFSFYPGKNLGAFGEGGAVVTRDGDLAAKIRMIRDHGQSQKYYHDIEGYNGRLDAIQAAVLRLKLKRLEDWNNDRRRHAKTYNQLLSEIPGITIPYEMDDVQSVYHLYVIHLDNRDSLQKYLADKGISTGLHYPMPLHLQKAYAAMGHAQGAFPHAEKSANRLLSLPMFPQLTQTQIETVANAVKNFMQQR